MFDRFHRAEGGLAKKQEGTGLGLYIAKRLVEAMGGSIWLVSSPGHGSIGSTGASVPNASCAPARARAPHA